MKIDAAAGMPAEMLDLLSQKEDIARSSKDLESIFVNQMLKTMRQSINKSGFVDGGNAENMYQGMLDNEYSKILADNEHIGLSHQIEKQLMKIVDPRELLNDPKLKDRLDELKSSNIKGLGRVHYGRQEQDPFL